MEDQIYMHLFARRLKPLQDLLFYEMERLQYHQMSRLLEHAYLGLLRYRTYGQCYIQ